ncbi:MAG: hypothetical protein ACTSSP_11485, partial [Candidatus Asgardarchaeia archaeon]
LPQHLNQFFVTDHFRKTPSFRLLLFEKLIKLINYYIYNIPNITDIVNRLVSTHNVPLTLLIEYISRRLEYTPEVFIIGIQPYRIELSETMSTPIKKTAYDIVDILLKILKRVKLIN